MNRKNLHTSVLNVARAECIKALDSLDGIGTKLYRDAAKPEPDKWVDTPEDIAFADAIIEARKQLALRIQRNLAWYTK